MQEVVDGQLPAPQAILRYNQRAVPVLAYVAQFSEPRINKSKIFDLDAREHTAIHRVLRFPPKCMSRALMHDVGFCSVISPIKLRDHCACILFRFACSEKDYIFDLVKAIRQLSEDRFSLADEAALAPYGGIAETPILQNLHDALNFQGPQARILEALQRDPSFAWLDFRQNAEPINQPLSRESGWFPDA